MFLREASQHDLSAAETRLHATTIALLLVQKLREFGEGDSRQMRHPLRDMNKARSAWTLRFVQHWLYEGFTQMTPRQNFDARPGTD